MMAETTLPKTSKMTAGDLQGLRDSELLRLAVWCTLLCDKDSRYHLFMEEWHRYVSPKFLDDLNFCAGRPESGVCLVCMAGSVMAKVVGASPTGPALFDGEGDDFKEYTSTAVRINSLRFEATDYDHTIDECWEEGWNNENAQKYMEFADHLKSKGR